MNKDSAGAKLNTEIQLKKWMSLYGESWLGLDRSTERLDYGAKGVFRIKW